MSAQCIYANIKKLILLELRLDITSPIQKQAVDFLIFLEDVCLDLLKSTVRNHVHNCSHLLKAADHIHVGVRTCAVYTGESSR